MAVVEHGRQTPDGPLEDHQTLLQRYHEAHERAQRAHLGSMEYRSAMHAVKLAHAALTASAVIDEVEIDDEPESGRPGHRKAG